MGEREKEKICWLGAARQKQPPTPMTAAGCLERVQGRRRLAMRQRTDVGKAQGWFLRLSTSVLNNALEKALVGRIDCAVG
jgi:hypothetical protein